MRLTPAFFKPRHGNSHRADAWKRCEPYLRWLRTKMPCFLAIHDRAHVCSGKVRACHFDPWGDKGMGTKVSDSAAMPMCDGAHAEQTDKLGWPEFQRKYEFDARDVVTAYWTHWLDTEAGRAWQRKQQEAA